MRMSVVEHTSNADSGSVQWQKLMQPLLSLVWSDGGAARPHTVHHTEVGRLWRARAPCVSWRYVQ